MGKNGYHIPAYELMHNNEPVSFAFRTMEEIYEKSGNVTDPPHRHNYFTVLWANNACGEHSIDYTQYSIRPNLIFFVTPGQVHQVITYGKPEGYVIMFTDDYLVQNQISEDFIFNLGLFSCSATTPPLDIKPENEAQLKNIAENIKATFHSEQNYKQEILSSYLKLFLIECNKLISTPNLQNPQLYQSSKSILWQFKQKTENHYKLWHKVSEYAQALNLSADYLNDVVKSAIGKTAKEFIQERICLEAKRMGLHTNLSTKEIAWELGFEDPSHFSKFFKNTENKSFTEFRKGVLASIQP